MVSSPLELLVNGEEQHGMGGHSLRCQRYIVHCLSYWRIYKTCVSFGLLIGHVMWCAADNGGPSTAADWAGGGCGGNCSSKWYRSSMEIVGVK